MKQKKVYQPPKLQFYGSIQQITLGTKTRASDSGGVQCKKFSGPC